MNKQAARTIALREMRKYGLLPDWSFHFDNAKMRFGRTNYRLQVITLSGPLVVLNSEDEMRQTMLHEIAHVLAGASHGHDRVWQRMAQSIGYRGERVATTSKVVVPQARYTVYCPNCGFSTPRHRKTSRLQACPKCCNRYNGGSFTAAYLLQWKLNPTVALAAK